jgi:serine/threonine-protein kinase RsbW
MDSEAMLRIEAELSNLSAIRRFVEEKATGLGVDPDGVSDMLLAVNEAGSNVILHGYQGQPGTIEIELSRRGESLVVRLRDQASPFDPTSVPPPDVTLPLEQRPYGGMGIHLIRQLMDEVTYRVTPQGGNELTLVKRINTP